MKLDWTSLSDITSSFDSRDADEVREALQDRVDGIKDHAEELAEWEKEDQETRGDAPECDWEPLTEDEEELLEQLTEWSEEIDDWRHGAFFIHESDFEDQMRELAEDCGYCPANGNPLLKYIDWEAWASDCKHDYSCYEVDGETFYVR